MIKLDSDKSIHVFLKKFIFLKKFTVLQSLFSKATAVIGTMWVVNLLITCIFVKKKILGK